MEGKPDSRSRAAPIDEEECTIDALYLARTKSIQSWLQSQGIAAGLVTAPVSMRYLCGWSNPSKRFAGLVIPATGEPQLVLPALEQEEASRTIQALRPWTDGQDAFQLAASVIREQSNVGQGFALEKDTFPIGAYERLVAHLGANPGDFLAGVGDLAPVITSLRATKSEAELAYMLKAADILNPALDAAMQAIAPGMTEVQLVEVLEKAMAGAGAQGVAFDTHVLFGANAALPHGYPGDRVAKVGEVILMDFGALYEGYRSDITRTVCLGPWTDEMAKVYDIVLAAHDAAITAARPGVTLESVDKAARDVITAHGYGEYFLHRTGHGLGLEIHEEPYVVAGNTQTLQAGHVVTIEPGIYLQGMGGVRIEDDIVITPDGCRSLTSWTTKRLSVDVR